MRRPSHSPQDSILGAGLWQHIVVAGALIAAASIAAGLLAPHLQAHVQTSIFVALGVGQLSVAWALRSRVRPRAIRDRAVEVAVISALALQLFAVYVPPLNALLGTYPLPGRALLVVLAVGTMPGLGVFLSTRLEPSPARHDQAERRAEGQPAR